MSLGENATFLLDNLETVIGASQCYDPDGYILLLWGLFW